MKRKRNGFFILGTLIVCVVLALKFVDVGQILKDKIQEKVDLEVEQIRYKVDAYKDEVKKEIEKAKRDINNKVNKIEKKVKDVEDKIKDTIKGFRLSENI